MSASRLREAAAELRAVVASQPEQTQTNATVRGVWLNSRHHLTIKPAVALAVADWLDVFAADEWPFDDCRGDECDYGPCLALRRALTVAEGYLGAPA
jgi:hypothetical protein